MGTATTITRRSDPKYVLTLALGALGVVYGDIGTSPLYSMRECFYGKHGLPVTPANIMGVLSLIFWSLIAIISIKYITFVMRADNRGEGGVLSLMAMAFPDAKIASRNVSRRALVALGVFGAALLYGDGMITPAITVLSAMEGLEVATPVFKRFIVPLTILVLVGLFWSQRFGTGKVGRIFGPVTLLWFGSIGLIGIRGISLAPDVLLAVNPLHAVNFFANNGLAGFTLLGAVFLVLTGGEALYADMGHFGRRPIKWAWFGLVLPALLLNYFGQGGLLLTNPGLANNPFYNLTPAWAIYPMVGLATAAGMIASQALISGAFSLTMQAIQLGYSPRLRIEHTSLHEKGQIYMPQINWFLMFAAIGLVLGFGSSANLAAAYGIAANITMLVTTVLFYFVARRLWNWPLWVTGLLCATFLFIELAFLGANVFKVIHGGWFPLLAGLGVFTLMSTWKTGRHVLGKRLAASTLPLKLFLEDIERQSPHRVSGTAVFLYGNAEGTPLALLHNLKHNKVLHKRNVILTVMTDEVPHVRTAHRTQVELLTEGFYRVTAHYGFMDDPDIPEVLDSCREHGLDISPQQITYFLSRETIIPTNRPGMVLWRERLFRLMAQNSQSATAFFHLPANRVVELGMQVEI
jgi:KUP system potassium uptake protein